MGPPTRMRDRAVAEPPEKDDLELRLEKAVFGDEAGFLRSLEDQRSPETSLTRVHHDDEDESVADEPRDGLSDVADDDLFFLDAGAGALPASVTESLARHEDNGPVTTRRDTVWYDSDDDRVRVSLAANTRLRKLRDTEDDDIVSGTEYMRRLRRQYERLHPSPAWVQYARKKRRLDIDRGESHEDSNSDSDSDADISMDDDDHLPSAQPLAELLRTAGALVRQPQEGTTDRRQRKLRPDVLDIARAKDVAGAGPSSVDSLQFHPYFPLLLSAGPSSTVTIYHISPQSPSPNPVLTSLHLKGTPLHTVEFCTPLGSARPEVPDPTRIFLSSRRRYFHTWSLATGQVTKTSRALFGDARHEQRTMERFKLSPCGRYMGLIGSSKKGGSNIHVLSTETMQMLCSCRIDSSGGVADLAWWRDGNGFAAVGKNGEISEFDLATRRVVLRWADEGAMGPTAMALGGDGGSTARGRSRWAAVGSSSGFVNLYDRRGWTIADTDHAALERPKAVRAFDHLTTPISHLEFTHDGQMLVMASRWKKNALRLIHLPSCTVYRNWPTDKTPLGRISAVALSLDGRWLSVGNEQGKVRLWEISE